VQAISSDGALMSS